MPDSDTSPSNGKGAVFAIVIGINDVSHSFATSLMISRCVLSI